MPFRASLLFAFAASVEPPPPGPPPTHTHSVTLQQVFWTYYQFPPTNAATRRSCRPPRTHQHLEESTCPVPFTESPCTSRQWRRDMCGCCLMEHFSVSSVWVTPPSGVCRLLPSPHERSWMFLSLSFVPVGRMLSGVSYHLFQRLLRSSSEA